MLRRGDQAQVQALGEQAGVKGVNFKRLPHSLHEVEPVVGDPSSTSGSLSMALPSRTPDGKSRGQAAG
jgi:hypothetical protein